MRSLRPGTAPERGAFPLFLSPSGPWPWQQATAQPPPGLRLQTGVQVHPWRRDQGRDEKGWTWPQASGDGILSPSYLEEGRGHGRRAWGRGRGGLGLRVDCVSFVSFINNLLSKYSASFRNSVSANSSGNDLRSVQFYRCVHSCPLLS